MANSVREFVIESLRGFYERLPLKKVAVDGSVLTPDASGIVNLNVASSEQLEDMALTTAAALNDLDTRVNDVSSRIEDIAVDLTTSVTYSELKTLRDSSSLVPGMQYRITDYTCTTTQADTSIAGHVFDIIVTAGSEAELNENAHAARHSGDTYFQTCDLDAWELKYCIDNDADRFAWADVTNGKGVIYYMKDEFDNECSYDFKNIMFTASGTNYYTFDVLVSSVHYDFSVAQIAKNCYGNIIEERYTNNSTSKLTLGRNIFKNISLLSTCYSNILENNCSYNIFGNNCYINTLGEGCSSNTFGDYCYNNIFGEDCGSNTFGNYFYNNTLGNYCSLNSFGNGCIGNTFGNMFYGNSFGNFRHNITVFDGVQYCSVTGGSQNHPVKNAQILNGTKGIGSNSRIVIYFESDKNYTQIAGLVNGTELRIWIAEDTVTGPTLSADGNIAIFDGVSGKVIKDSGLQISDLTSIVETTWSTLKLLKGNSSLVPGRMYRIIDYNTTVSEDLTDVSVANHQFDVIVTALSETELDHRASAIQHAGDTYFSDCDLSKWQLWYDIENDTEKYSWAVGDSSSGNGGAKGNVSVYTPEYISADKTTAINLDKAGLSQYLVLQGIEIITIKGEDVECYVYGTSVQAAALGYTKIFCQEYPSAKTDIYAIDNKGGISLISGVNAVSSSMQPTNGTKIIAKSITSDYTANILNKAGISPELEFNGRIVMYKGQNCYSYGSSAQYTALANEFKNITDIIVTDGVSPIAPKKAFEPGTGVIILDDEVGDSITAVSQETVVVGGTGGTGVIYRMIDEWGNDCPYDFKNIKFQRWAVTACQDCPDLVVDSSDNTYGYYYGAKWLGSNLLTNATYGENDYFYTFALKDLESDEWFDYTVVAHLGLKNNLGNEISCYDNHLTEATNEYNSGKGEMTKVLSNIVFFNCYTDLSDTSSANNYSHCNNNRFLGNCYVNTFGNDCYGNSFESNCAGNTFGNICQNNTFGTCFRGNTFGIYCLQNSFGNYCYSNLFKKYCSQNSFGNFCYNNSLQNCIVNSFGNYCHDNSFGNECHYNSFGNCCYNNSFGSDCQSNSFGNDCWSNTFGDYCQTITAFDGIMYCNITGGTSSAPVKNAQILNGTKGTSNTNRLTITFTANQNYTQIAGLNSSGVLKIWTPADLID